MMDNKRIFICDDDSRTEETLMQSIAGINVLKEGFEIDFSRDRLKSVIDALEERVKKSRGTQSDQYPADEANIIDSSSILVIDYDLLATDISLTGERVAYLARCYSGCGFIVGLNQFRPYVDEYFDLTLVGHPESFADLNIPSNSLSNLGLWQEPWRGFRPWYWPLLIQANDNFEKSLNSLHGHLDDPIFDFFGFGEKRSLSLSRKIFEFLHQSQDPARITFREFVLNSGNGLQRKDKPFSEETIARIAVARIHNWLENIVLPGQDVLVDAPHLISRYPSLMQGDFNDINQFNRTASIMHPNELGISPIIEEFRFQKEFWLSRPAWFWSNINNCNAIKEVADPWSVKKSSYVFCEDISGFLHYNSVKGFVANLDSPFVRRFVKKLDGINYSPQARLSL